MEQLPDVDYQSVARDAGLDDKQLQLIEQLFGVHRESDSFPARAAAYGVCQLFELGRLDIGAVHRLLKDQAEVEAQIRTAFAGVRRGNGTSWQEGFLIARDATEEECAAARSLDPDRPWDELVDDPHWPGHFGPWATLDALGYRYYVAPAMIKATRQCMISWLGYFLRDPGYEEELQSILTRAQMSAVERFLEFSLDVHKTFEWAPSQIQQLEEACRKWQSMRT